MLPQAVMMLVAVLLPARRAATPLTSASPRGVVDTIEFMPLNGGMLGDCASTAPTLNDTIPCRVRRQFTAAQLIERLDASGNAWVEGTQLTFATRTNVGGVRILGGISLPMAHVPGTDLWVVTVHVPNAERALLTYSFGTHNEPTREFRGALAPPAPLRSVRLKGRILRDTISSAALGEPREVLLYLPPGTTRGAAQTVLLADGQAVDQLAPFIDTLIASKQMRPVALVGITSPPLAPGKVPMRTAEYVLGAVPDSTRFLAHERFVMEEVLPHVSAKYGVATSADRLALAGLSNGAAFAITMATRHQRRFNAAIALSPAGRSFQRVARTSLPRMYITAGTLEAPFYRIATLTSRALEQSGAAVTFVRRVSGHEDIPWATEFPIAMKWLAGSP